MANVGSLLSDDLLLGALVLLCKLKDSPEFSLPPISHIVVKFQHSSYICFNHSTNVKAVINYYGTSNESIEDFHFKLKPDF